MVALGVTVPFNPGESVTSFASRLASRNLRASARSFCLDMAFNFQQIINGDRPSLARLADLGGVPFDEISRTALHRIGDKIFVMGGQKLMPTAVSRSSLVICPKCLQEDVAGGLLPPASAVWGRLEWQFTAIRTCRVHEASLVDVSGYIRPGQTHDFAANLRPHLGELSMIGTTPRPFSQFEHYVRNRLFGFGQAPLWLDEVGYSAATYGCSIFGAVALFGQKTNVRSLNQHQWALASDKGFSILKGGYETARPFLKSLADQVDRQSLYSPGTVLGPIHQWLGFGSRDPDTAPIANMVREHVSSTMPFGSETYLYGSPLPARRIHSVRSAALHYGIHQKTLKNVLSGIGVIPPRSSKVPDNQCLFDATEYAPLLGKLALSMTRKQVLEYTRMPRMHFDAAVRHGLVSPIATGQEFEMTFARDDIDRFVSALLAHATPVEALLENQTGIKTAALRACCAVVEIMKMLISGELKFVGSLGKASGYTSLIVDSEEVRSRVRGAELNGLSLGPAADEIGISAEAWRRIIDVEGLPSKTEINPVNRCPVQVVSFDTLENFKAKYRSLRHLAKEAKTVPHRKQRLLAESGVMPIARFSLLGATLYDRSKLI